MTGKTIDVHAERELEGIWFLSTFLDFGFGSMRDPETDKPAFTDERNPLKVGNISYVDTADDSGFSQVNVTLENGDTWRIEVERIT